MEIEKENDKKQSWIEASKLPEGEKVYLKKDFMGWRVVEPWKREDGSVNWFVVLTGGKRNLVMLIAILILVTILWLGIHELISGYQEVAAAPCKFCLSCFENTIDPLTKINFSVGAIN